MQVWASTLPLNRLIVKKKKHTVKHSVNSHYLQQTWLDVLQGFKETFGEEISVLIK